MLKFITEKAGQASAQVQSFVSTLVASAVAFFQATVGQVNFQENASAAKDALVEKFGNLAETLSAKGQEAYQSVSSKLYAPAQTKEADAQREERVRSRSPRRSARLADKTVDYKKFM